MVTRIGFGGGCHWCTEAMFVFLDGVDRVEQGWIGADGEDAWLSEGVIVHFDPARIAIATLVAVHLHTHSSTSMHRLRERYRSAVYVDDDGQSSEVRAAIDAMAIELGAPAITRVLALRRFESSDARDLDYYRTDPQRPFCTTYIEPKLAIVRARFGGHLATRRG